MKFVKGKTVNGKMQFLRGTITENKKSSAKMSISVMLSFFFYIFIIERLFVHVGEYFLLISLITDLSFTLTFQMKYLSASTRNNVVLSNRVA